MEVRKIVFEDVNWIKSAHDRVKLGAFVIYVLKFRVPGLIPGTEPIQFQDTLAALSN
jgi:hypothetical protein